MSFGRTAVASAILVGVFSGCGPSVPLGVYRLPMQTGDDSLQLRTLLVRLEGQDLVLRDVFKDKEIGRTSAGVSWMGEPRPHQFGKVDGYPFTLYLRDSVLEDIEARPWQTQPSAPLVPSAETVTIATLSSVSSEMKLLRVGDLVFANEPVLSPKPDAIPEPLTILGSIAGAGLILREDAVNGAEWKDAVSAFVPYDPSKTMTCGVPIRSLYRSAPGAKVWVPAGEFDAVHVTEIVDVCPDSTVEPTVWTIERWFAPGIGPVRVLATLSDGHTREYLLVDTSADGSATSIWPLDQGLWWDWQVLDSDGNIVQAAVRVEVTSLVERSFPD